MKSNEFLMDYRQCSALANMTTLVLILLKETKIFANEKIDYIGKIRETLIKKHNMNNISLILKEDNYSACFKMIYKEMLKREKNDKTFIDVVCQSISNVICP